MRISVVTFDGADELDFVGPLEVLRMAADTFRVDLVTLDAPREITASHGLRVTPDGKLDESADLLLVPGGGWSARAPKGVLAELQRGALPQRIAELYAAGTIIASVCTGALLVAASGIARGRRMTTHHHAFEALEGYGITVKRERVVDDGDIISGGGVLSGIDVALHIVERYAGADIALQIAEAIELRNG